MQKMIIADVNRIASQKKYLLNDGYGLYLRVDMFGSKYWILRFRENEQKHQISLGVNLDEARKKRDEIQNRRKNGELISSHPYKSPATFQEVADECLKIRIKNKAANYLQSSSQFTCVSKNIFCAPWQIFKFSIASDWCENDPTIALAGHLPLTIKTFCDAD